MSETQAMRLHALIAAVAPIDGVSLGDLTDKATWRVNYVGTPTAPQLSAVASVIAAFDPTAPDHVLTIDELYDQAILTQRVLKALVLALNDGTLPIGTNKTPAQLKTIIKARM